MMVFFAVRKTKGISQIMAVASAPSVKRGSGLLLGGGGGGAEMFTHVLNLVLVEGGDGVNQHVGQAAAKVDNFVHCEGHDAGGEGIILPPEVPSSPQALGNVEVNIDLGDLFKDGVVIGSCCRVETGGYGGIERGERRGSRRQLLDFAVARVGGSTLGNVEE